ncbi:PilZ domain-containing protein [Desulfospira joergensenii]|uniref:PilZ domain-containing protein n=1 Tax=Desulfospira joergensenii TaxID=53329 RepID=UPI0003B3AE13|nr:PilZ domain-containing protein [Desulfospira joergensenii]
MKKKKIKIEAVNPGDREDKREAFRYIFSRENRPSLSFLGKSVKLINISAGGLAFENNGFSIDDQDRIHLNLDIPDAKKKFVLTAMARISHIDRESICRCIFEDLDREQEEEIHRYVLEKQKKDLRN